MGRGRRTVPPSISGTRHRRQKMPKTSGPVTTVIVDQPHRRNAVDRPPAEALVSAFEAFEADAAQRVGGYRSRSARAASARICCMARVSWSE